jgi:hypothetical protein
MNPIQEKNALERYDVGGPLTRKKLREMYPELFRPAPGASIIATVREKLAQLRKVAA